MNSKNQPFAPDLRSFNHLEKLAVAGTLLAAAQWVATPANAAPAEENAKPEGGTATLPELVVQADGTKKLYKPEQLSSQKYTVPLRDVPQTVAVIPSEVIQEQGVSSLRDVLKNVPGISIQAGEGGVPAGDNLAIRGFSARTDLFVDGVRDFGGSSRDPFNIEQVEVTKGPSSTQGGRGSTGGSINLSTKMPHLGNERNILLGGGSDAYTRSTVDLNQEIPGLKGSAVRLNALYHSQDVAGRDYVEQERWGVAPSISFGLGTETRFTLSYFHFEQNNLPDYGIPWIPRENSVVAGTENNTGLPSGRPDVNYSNFYGLLSRDYEKNQTDIITSIIEHDFNENLKLRNITRYGNNTTDLSVTAPRFFTASTLPAGADPSSVNRTWRNRDQEDSIVANQTELRYDFETGPIKHEMLAALEFSHEKSKNRTRGDRNTKNLPPGDLKNPNANDAYDPDFFYTGASTDASADSTAISLFDTIKLNEKWILSGGVRWDKFQVDSFSAPARLDANGKPVTTPLEDTELSRKDITLSYRAAITFKPTEDGSIYLGYGTSFNPPAEGLTLSGSTSDPNNPAFQRGNNFFDVEPEENRTIELGTKWDLLDDKLLLTGALFRTDKTAARTVDPADPEDVISLDGEQRVQGFELGFTGLITQDWRILGGYTYLDSEIRKSDNDFEVGNAVSNTPRNSFSLWTVHDLPKGFQIGLGAQHVGSRFNNSNRETRQEAASYTTLDTLIGYQLNENVSFRLNGYNLLDKEYIDRVGGGHFVPGQGRLFTLTADIKF